MNIAADRMGQAAGERHAAPFRGAALRGVSTLAQARPDLPPDVLLHAGPPYGSDAVPAPVRNAAAHALIYEGMATDAGHAARLLDSGRLRFAPAQDYGIVTPLAQVVTRSMPVLHVGDDHDMAYAPLAEGPPPALRFGSPDLACVVRARHCADMAINDLGPWLADHPIAIDAMVRDALQAGDECHSRTGAANLSLSQALQGMPQAALDTIRANPGFVLTVLMAASAWVLKRVSAGRARAIVAAGGNGVRFGLRLAGAPAWRSVPADPPIGTRRVDGSQVRELGAIGDSAVIDLCGLGGQALPMAPELAAEWQTLLPADWAQHGAAVLDAERGVVDIDRIVASGCVPSIHLAILDADGRLGLIGRGFYRPPMALFRC